MQDAGFNVTHLYGLTEIYGPAVVNEWHAAWDKLAIPEQAARKARQGVRYPVLEALDVLDPKDMKPVPRDGATLGEVMFRGNMVMKGYLKNKAATRQGLQGRLVPFGRPRRHASRTAICSSRTGPRTSSSRAARISRRSRWKTRCTSTPRWQRPQWLQGPTRNGARRRAHSSNCATGKHATAEELIDWCRAHLAQFKVPRHMVFAEIPKTSTGKIQKFKLRDMAKDV